MDCITEEGLSLIGLGNRLWQLSDEQVSQLQKDYRTAKEENDAEDYCPMVEEQKSNWGAAQ